MYRLTVQYETPADPDAFDAQYFGQHVPLCRTLPGIAGAAFCKPSSLGPGDAPYLVAELDFADARAFGEAMQSPEGVAVAKDADTLPAGRQMFAGEVTGG